MISSTTSTNTPASKTSAPRRPTILIILDGVGVNPSHENNAVALAKTPNLDRYYANNAHTTLQASGNPVGLPDGQMGNSEVGHTIIGAGSVIKQDLVLIDEAIQTNAFFKNEVLITAVKKAKEDKRPLHLFGLVSDGGVHSHTRHLFALFELCHRHGVKPLLHVITDGRDVAPKAFQHQIETIEQGLTKACGSIASICGRYFALDRDHRWDRTEKAWRCMVEGAGHQAENATDAIAEAYEKGQTDEFIEPIILPDFWPITSEDQIICFNFRRDRPRQIVCALYKEEFDSFDRGDYQVATVSCLTEYDSWFNTPYAFEQDKPETTLAETVSRAGLKQFHCAETEKYAHVTFFLNGGHGDVFPGEVHQIIDSPDVATYDLMPEMSAAAVATAVIDAIESYEYPLIIVNFANGDMVGHTAIREAVIKAVESLDKEVGRVLDAASQHGFSVLLTADHGNCDEMVDPFTGEPHTQHTTYPVPCLIMDETNWVLSNNAGLGSIAPTILQLMGLQKPEAMTERSILISPA